MSKTIDMTGRRVGIMTVIAPAGIRYRDAVWLVRCDCGEERTVPGSRLRRGQESCGCLAHKATSARHTKHGETHTPTWVSWMCMRKRCHSPGDPSYFQYGAVGITVCEAWRSPDIGYRNFVADMGHRPAGKTLDRIDGSAGYSPENCRWATPTEQNNNRKTNRVLTFAGESRTCVEWGRRIGVSKNAVLERLRRGWSVQKAVTLPVYSG